MTFDAMSILLKSFTTEYKEIWKENLVIYQKSLKAFLQAPLQLKLISAFPITCFVIGTNKAYC